MTRGPRRNIVVGQRVDPTKLERARQLRRGMTPQERRLWEALRSNRMGGLQFRRQQVIDRFIVDFYCHAVGLIVEVDGPIHEQQGGYDLERGRILGARGLNSMRFTNEEVTTDLAGVLRRIAAACGVPTPPLAPPRRGEGIPDNQPIPSTLPFLRT